MIRAGFRAFFTTFAVALVAACGCRRPARESVKPPRIEDFSWGPVQVAMTIDPPEVDLTRGVQLSIAVTAPPEIEVTLPPLSDRVQGFSLGGMFDDEPVSRDGKVTRTHHVQLTPLVADRYRIAPMPVEYVDKAVHPPRKGWFPTRAIVIETVPLVKGQAGQSITERLDPVWIYPPFQTVLVWLGGVVLALAALFGVWKLATRVRENIQLARMSPRDRALKELEKLLSKDLIRRNLVKEFYLELTMIVRRYIERSHAVRAPEQTTEEFLSAAAANPAFKPEVLRRLRSFLRAADLVKFAAHDPDENAIHDATRTAKEYIEKDAQETDASPPVVTK